MPIFEVNDPQDTPQVEALLKVFKELHNRSDLQEKLALKNRENFKKKYLQPALELSFIALSILGKSSSSKQQYYLTEIAKEYIKLEM